MSSHPFNIWSWHGRVGRARYLVTGVILLAVKHNIDRLLAALYGYPWSIFNYWVFDSQYGISKLKPEDATFYASVPGVGISYQTGKLQIMKLLAEARLAQGDKFNLREFHDFVWKNGNVPIALLRYEYLGKTDEIEALQH